MTWLYQWAAQTGHDGPRKMPTVEDLTADGYEIAGKDPRYPSVLMRKLESRTA